MAVIYSMVDGHIERPDLPDDEMPGDVLEKESILRQVEAYAHSEGCWNFTNTLVPAARSALKRVGFA